MSGRDHEPYEPSEITGFLTEMTTESNVVYQAAGFVSGTLKIPVDTALTVLLEEAHTADVDLAVLAREVITRRRPVPAPRDGTAPPPAGGGE